MDYTGSNINADFEAMWNSIVTDFPAMADAYATANLAVHYTHNCIDFETRFFPEWAGLRNELEEIFASDTLSLQAVATALAAAVNDYAGTDNDAADALDKAQDDLPDEVPDMTSPRTPPSRHNQAPPAAVPPSIDTEYDAALTFQQLQTKAQTTDDKQWEAEMAERSLLGKIPIWIAGREKTEEIARDSGMYTFTTEKVAEVSQIDPKQFQIAISCLKSIAQGTTPFSQFEQEVSNAKDALHPDKWDGTAAGTFRSEFLNVYPDVVDNQVPIVGSLLGAMEGFQKGVKDTYDSYDEAMDAAIKAYDQIIAEADAAKADLMTAVLSAAISIAGAIAAGPGGISYALAGAGVSIASAGYSVGGSKAADVHASLFAGLDKAKKKLNEFDTELKDAMETDTKKVSSRVSKPKGKVRLPRPAFVDSAEGF